MSSPDPVVADSVLIDPRGFGRRAEDRKVRDKIRRFEQLTDLGQAVTSEIEIEALFELIAQQTNEIMRAERSTIFVHDASTSQLWSLVATGMGSDEIRIDARSGVAGWVFQQRAPLVIDDAYADPRFNVDVDKSSGFVTRGLLAVPVISRDRSCIGVLETMNPAAGAFSADDAELLGSIARYVAIAIENARLYDDVKRYSEKLEAEIIRSETLEQAKAHLTKFVPSSVAQLVDQDPAQLDGEKVSMDVSVLFLDIQGFSRITEQFDQRLVNDMVEAHFSRYLDCVHRHGGEINETSGDGLMVIFKGDTDAMHAENAVGAGLEIVRENRALNRDLTYPWGRVELHLGINSGPALVGATRMRSVTGERWTLCTTARIALRSRPGSRIDPRSGPHPRFA